MRIHCINITQAKAGVKVVISKQCGGSGAPFHGYGGGQSGAG